MRAATIIPAARAATVALTLYACAAAVCAQGDRTEGPAAAASPLMCALPTNCVNSLGAGGLRPLRFEGDAAAGMTRLQATVAGFAEAKVTRVETLRLETIFSTPAGFRDRVEFIIDPQAGRIDYRSYSMFGLFDWGKNRSRMLDVAERFEQQPTP